MTGHESPDLRPRGARSLRRLALLATTVAGLGAAALVAAPNLTLKPDVSVAFAQDLTKQAQKAPAPVGFADIVERVKPAVVSVRVKHDASATQMGVDGSQMERFFRRFGLPEDLIPQIPRVPRQRPTTGQGSGFLISPDGYAVTNNHVVAKAETVEVTTDDGKTYTAKVIGTDPRTDLALIKMEGRSDFPYVQLADKSPRIGDWVLAVGNPFGLGGTVTAGIVSARGRDIGAGPYDDFIQIDAPVNRGNSGGPTFDVEGKVIGVNTAIFSPSGGNVGIAFAIPAETVRSVVMQLKDNGTVTRGWIGVQIQRVTPEIAESMGLKEATGALVAQPQPNSPAVKAGIEAGDVITAVNGTPVKDARNLARQIGAMAPNTTVKLTIIRKGAERTISLTLGELPKEQQQASAKPDENSGAAVPRLGLQLAPASEVTGAGREGVVVTGIDAGSVAAEQGLKVGDVILEAGGKKVSQPQEIRSMLNEAQSAGRQTVLLRVKSGEATRFVALRMASS